MHKFTEEELRQLDARWKSDFDKGQALTNERIEKIERSITQIESSLRTVANIFRAASFAKDGIDAVFWIAKLFSAVGVLAASFWAAGYAFKKWVLA